MVLAWKYCWCVILVASINAFNVTVDNIAVFEDPNKASSSSSSSRSTYFGYSVALQADGSGRSWIHIGAPKANDWELPGFDEPGVLYRCEIGSSCEKRKLLAPSNANLDHAILGGSIAIRDNQLMVCGSNAYVVRLNQIDVTGICYDLSGNGSREEGASSLRWNSNPNIRPENEGNGFSVHAIPQTSPVEFLVGSPIDQYGYIRRYKKTSNTWTRSAQSYAIEGSDIQSYGYAVTSGHYFNLEKRVYAMGAPRGKNLFGEVLLQDFDSKMSKEKEEAWTILAKPGQIGEFFGASLATCELTGDGYDELLVGAPLWSRSKDNEEQPDVGRVYIYTADTTFKASLKWLKTLEGEAVVGRFGSVITCLGDIDHDGHGDVAVSAPYNGNGVVYIYNGDNNGLRDTYTQLIASPSNVRGFGFSISEPEDIDRNGFKDIAVGASFSGHVIAYRSKIIVRLHTSAESLSRVAGKDANKAYFRTRLCTSFIPVDPSGISTRVRNLLENDNRVAVTYHVNIDQENRGSIRHKTFSTTTRDGNDKMMMCEDINFAMNKMSGKLWMNVSASLNVTGEDDGIFTIGSRDSLDKSVEYLMVVDRSGSNHNVAKPLPDLTLCNDAKCRANLQVELTSDLTDGNTYFIGTKPNIRLFIHVKNIGEEAFDTRTIIRVPAPLAFLSSGSSHKCGICSSPIEDNTCIDCLIDDPLLTGNNKTIVLELDASRVTEGYGTLVIRTNTSTQSDDESLSQNIKSLEINSRMDVKVALKGETGMIHSYRQDSSDSILFAQEYDMINSGKTLLERAVFTAYFPMNWREREFVKLKSTTGYINGTWVNLDCEESWVTESRSNFEGSASFDHNRHRVSCNDPSAKCGSIECQLRSIKEAGSVIRIRLSFETNPSNIAFVSGNGTSVVFETSAKISNVFPKISETSPDVCDCTFSMQTIFMEPIAEPSNALNWIIIVSVLLGLLLLAILGFVLYKFGFFNRKKKADLEKLQGQGPSKATEQTALRDAVEIE